MSQSNFIALFIFAAFIVFITARGELRQWMGLLLGTQTTPTKTDATDPLTTLTNAATTIGKIAAVGG